MDNFNLTPFSSTTMLVICTISNGVDFSGLFRTHSLGVYQVRSENSIDHSRLS